MGSQSEQIAEYLRLSDHELLTIMADIGPIEGASTADESNRELIGKAWFAVRANELREKVCLYPAVVYSLGSDTEHDPVILAGLVLDAISAVEGQPTLFAFAALLVRRGLHRYCLPNSP